MKAIRGRVQIFGFITITGALLLSFFGSRQHIESEKQVVSIATNEHKEPVSDSKPVPLTTNSSSYRSFTKRLSDMSEAEKSRLAQRFEQEYKPAMVKWFDAYEGRIPFRPEDFTLETFHSRLGDNMFTFMIGDTTFTIQDSPKLGVKISYLMTRRSAEELNSLPSPSHTPNLVLPVTRDDIKRMVKSDTGADFKSNEIIIRPTGAATSLGGGAFVDVLPSGKDPNNALNYPVSLVFSADGTLVNYERDPFF